MIKSITGGTTPDISSSRLAISKKILVWLLLAAFFTPSFFLLAELTPEQEKAQLEQELKGLEEEIAKYEKDITKTQQEKKTLQNQISVLKKKISSVNLQIQQSNLIIKDVSFQIKDTEQSIDKTSKNIEESKKKLAAILRTIYEEDQKSFVELLLSGAQISDFFDNLVNLEVVNNENKDLLENIKGLKVTLETEKQSLDDEKGDLENLLKMQTLQKQESESNKKDQEKLLEQTKGKESEYQKMLEASKKKAAELRARLFELAGVSQAPTFGEALDVAKWVSGITGIRTAFLLAIIEQESALGQNVGQCYLVNAETGAGVGIKTGNTISRVMSPKRDVPHFLNITQNMGRDSYKTPVSCPMSFGWGGAMGPAQFIPSTWMIYNDRVKAVTGTADPWNIRDSFLAAGFYLTDYGAAKQDRNSEWKAAMLYFSGSTSSKYSFYGNSALSRADRIQGWIDDIEKAGN